MLEKRQYSGYTLRLCSQTTWVHSPAPPPPSQTREGRQVVLSLADTTYLQDVDIIYILGSMGELQDVESIKHM